MVYKEPVVHLEKDCSSDINTVYLTKYQTVKHHEQSCRKLRNYFE
jgi:hypothetical protein